MLIIPFIIITCLLFTWASRKLLSSNTCHYNGKYAFDSFKEFKEKFHLYGLKLLNDTPKYTKPDIYASSNCIEGYILFAKLDDIKKHYLFLKKYKERIGGNYVYC